MNIRRWIIKRKGNRCEAWVWCWRRPIGSVIAIPEGPNGEELGQLAIWVCAVHKEAATDAAEKFAKNYEKEQEAR